MEFLEKILGEELYKQVAEKINAHNGDEANKENLIKLANLATGDYVAKGKYDSLQTSLTGKETELSKANELIAELQKGTKDNEELQGKITAYEGQVQELQEQLAEEKLNSAIKIALMEARASDVPYMTYKLEEKLKEKGEKLELDDNGNIKNFDTHLDGLKTQFPTMFETGDNGGKDGYTPVPNKGLPQSYGNQTVTREQFLKMGYEERAKLKASNEALFKQLNNQ